MIKFWNDTEGWYITEIGMYSDSTPFIKTPYFDDIVSRGTGVTIKAHTLVDLFAGLAMVRSINDSDFFNPPIKTLVLPYIPGARQDRYNIEGDTLSTLSLVGSLIDSMNFTRVIAADPHSDIAHVYIDNLVEYPMERVYSRLPEGYDGVIAPDKGAKSRAQDAGAALGVPVYYGSKVRDVSTGRLAGFEIAPLEPGGHYIVIDDICDGGGTFVGLGSKIVGQGATADLFVTHGIFAHGTKSLSEFYEDIFTTDTREINDRNSVIEFPIVNDMEKF